ncbi:hypothetical protein [Streptomyces sp. TLI_171]|uniref:hypothetical protein n=1 Tax=Streptomyces sp. TLI_171 TaxID=1938859 RepID=UPI000C18654E|nr:hypothetical protein [Streptomyces sp. TLI_171]RKE23036.1 hypothetical protein BX266_6492 [Streptomyces sp. TLI_171]
MSVSVYYSARRATALTAAESAEVERVVAAFPFPEEEGLCLYGGDGAVLAGSTKLPFDPELVLPVLAAVLDGVTALRRAVAGAQWHVHLDDLDVPWDEEEGYALPGMRDPDLSAGLW